MNNNDTVNVLRSTNVPVWVTFNNQERLEDLAGRVAVQIEADSLDLTESMRDSSFLSTMTLINVMLWECMCLINMNSSGILLQKNLGIE